jgi:hypothetical protein
MKIALSKTKSGLRKEPTRPGRGYAAATGCCSWTAQWEPTYDAPSNNRMKLTNPLRAAFGVACSPFGEHRGFAAYPWVLGGHQNDRPRGASTASRGDGRECSLVQSRGESDAGHVQRPAMFLLQQG